MVLDNYENGKRVSAEGDTVFKCISAEPRRQLIVSLLDTQPGQSVPLPESAAMRNVPLILKSSVSNSITSIYRY